MAVTVNTALDVVDGDIFDGTVSLRDALALAPADETIDFAQSLDGQTISLTMGELVINKALTIDASSLANGLTIDASGNDPTPGVADGQGSRVFNIDDGDEGNFIDVAIRGMTLTGGDVGDLFEIGVADGGAIRSVENLTIIDSTITANSAGFDRPSGDVGKGGGVSSRMGDLTILGSTISGNSVLGDGGGIYAVNMLTLDESTVSGNVTANGFDSYSFGPYGPDGGSGGRGGGIFATGAVQINNSNITWNTTGRGGAGYTGLADAGYSGGAGGDGGGIFATGTLRITQSTISGNTTGGGGAGGEASFIALDTIGGFGGRGGRGAGVYASGTLTVNQSTISGNTTGDGGWGGNGNTAPIPSPSHGGIGGAGGSGGGIYAAAAEITGSTISANRTGYGGYGGFGNSYGGIDGIGGAGGFGGGIRASDTLTVSHSTITGNVTGDGGGSPDGFYSDGGAGGGISFGGDTVLISNSIVATNATGIGESNMFGIGPDLAPGSGALTVSYSLIGDNTGTGLAEAQLPDIDGNLIGGPTGGVIDPMLAPLANHGGPTETHALILGSPAIDAGDPDAEAGMDDVPEFDQRGEPFARVFGTQIDMGAYESQQSSIPALVVDNLEDEFDTDYGPDDLSLREAIALANINPGQDTITFDTDLDGDTILLLLGEMDITEALVIDASTLAAGLTIDAQQQSRIFNIVAETGNFDLLGMTLTGGRTTGDDPVFPDTTYDGGAIRSMTYDLLTITGSTITGNSTQGRYAFGGGIFAVGAVTLTGSTVSGNYTQGDAALGGGIAGLDGVTLIDSTISGNHTEGYDAGGGGIYAYGSVTLTNSTVSGNYVQKDYAEGGGIFADGDVELIGSTVTGNHTDGNELTGGGGIFSYGIVTLTSSTVSRNYTQGNGKAGGGGVFAFSGADITNSTISGNQTRGTAEGGGLFSYGNISILHSTITDNHAGTAGGGIYDANNRGPVAVTISNSIVAANTAGGDAPDLGLTVDTLTVEYSLIGDNTGTDLDETPGGSQDPTTGNIIGGLTNGVIDPMLAPLANNGGPTKTHALLPGSLAIDAGDLGFNPNDFEPPLLNDQRGEPFARVFGTQIDMGAYERQTLTESSFIVDTLVDENDGDYSPGDLSLREAIGLANGSVNSADTINFDPALTAGGPATIMLTLGELGITDALTISGPGANLLTIDASGNDATPGEADGMGTSVFRIDDGDDFSQVFVTLAGLTITGGDVAGQGGGIHNREQLTLVDSRVIGNVADEGGGIWSIGDVNDDDFDLMISGSTISGNTARNGPGGGIFALYDVELIDSTVSGSHTEGFQARGGGIYAGGEVTLNNSTVSENHTEGSESRGGGIYGTDITLINSTVSGNYTEGNSADGGGIYVRADVTLDGSTVSGNYARSRGGGISAGSTVTLTNSMVSGNHTSADGAEGGGIYALGDITLTNSTISGNHTEGFNAAGGGIYVRGDVTLLDSTVSENYTEGDSADGGGISAFGLTSLNNSTVSGNHTVEDNASGGGIFARGDVSLINSTVSGNHTEGRNAGGGGVIGSNVSLTNSSVSENHTQGDLAEGGGIQGSSITLAGSSVSENHTQGDSASGGGISAGTEVRLTDSIVSGNFTQGGAYGGGIVTLGKVTLTNSEVSGNHTQGQSAHGGGIWGGDVTLAGSIVSGNHTQGSLADGGGIRGFTVTLSGSSISGNYTQGFGADGGGIYAFSEITLTDNSTVGDNYTLGEFATGGGIYGSTVELTNSTVSGNHTEGDMAEGGGIRASNVTISNSTVSGNYTEGALANGGGIFAAVRLEIDTSEISGNRTGDAPDSDTYGPGVPGADGGGIFATGEVTITHSTISGNTTGDGGDGGDSDYDFVNGGGGGRGGDGGGIFATDDLTITNSTISGNTTGDGGDGGEGSVYGGDGGRGGRGGGIYVSGMLTIIQSTISGNATGEGGEGGYGFDSDGSDAGGSPGGGIFASDEMVSILGSIVAGNTAGGGNPDLAPGTGTLTVEYSLIGDNAGTDLLEAQSPDSNGNFIGQSIANGGSGIIDPLLGPLANNGGPTLTHALLPGSTAIDAGDPGFDPNDFDPPLVNDQRGDPFIRVFGGRVDMGAVEAGNFDPSIDTLSITSPIDEGSPITLSGTYSDPDALDTHVLDIDWDGDGTYDQTVAVSGGTFDVIHPYADDGEFNVGVRLRDSAAGEDIDSVPLMVDNVPPTLSISGAPNVDEAVVYTLNLSSSDVGTDTISQWTINWGDEIEVVAGDPTSVTHVYADGQASHDISATATDEDGTYAAGNTVSVTVNNVPPTLSIGGPTEMDEGALYTLNLSSSDPGDDTITQWTINWGDVIEVVAGNPISVTHTYDGDAGYEISATATDEDGTYAAGNTVSVTVNNVPPTLSISGAANVDEGAAYTLNLSSFDTGSDTIVQWKINWGDEVEVVVGNPTSVTHTYADGQASYEISATATDEDGTYAAGNTVSVTVNNVPPTLSISGAANVDEAAVYTLNLSSNDTGTDTIAQWTINWGDEIEVIAGNPTSVTHTYADGQASHDISATATDEDGTYAAGNTVSVTVNNVPPTLSISGAANVDEAVVYTLNLSSSDVGTDTISQWTINWGDEIEVVAGDPTSVTHTYADGQASHDISATATDEDGTYAAGNTVSVTVNNVPPMLSISGAANVDEAAVYTLNLSSSDVGDDTISQWTINWGDEVEVVSGNPASVGHAYAVGGASYEINATATDEDGTFIATQTVSVTVNSLPDVSEPERGGRTSAPAPPIQAPPDNSATAASSVQQTGETLLLLITPEPETLRAPAEYGTSGYVPTQNNYYVSPIQFSGGGGGASAAAIDAALASDEVEQEILMESFLDFIDPEFLVVDLGDEPPAQLAPDAAYAGTAQGGAAKTDGPLIQRSRGGGSRVALGNSTRSNGEAMITAGEQEPSETTGSGDASPILAFVGNHWRRFCAAAGALLLGGAVWKGRHIWFRAARRLRQR